MEFLECLKLAFSFVFGSSATLHRCSLSCCHVLSMAFLQFGIGHLWSLAVLQNHSLFPSPSVFFRRPRQDSSMNVLVFKAIYFCVSSIVRRFNADAAAHSLQVSQSLSLLVQAALGTWLSLLLFFCCHLKDSPCLCDLWCHRPEFLKRWIRFWTQSIESWPLNCCTVYRYYQVWYSAA